jgi:hypothetical protein
MDGHGFMHGMMWAGALLASIPVAVGIAGGIFLYRRYRDRPDQPGRTAAGPQQASDGTRRLEELAR